MPAGVPALTGLAFLNGELYGTAGSSDNNQIYIIDPNTFNVVKTESTGISDSDLVGLAGDPSRGVLWAVGQEALPDRVSSMRSIPPPAA